MPTLKFLKDCGKRYPAGHVTDDTPEIRSYLENGGYVLDEDFGLVTPEDDVSRAIGERLDAAMGEKLDAAIDRAMNKAMGGVAETLKRKIEPGPEPVDKDPRRGYRSLEHFAHDIYMCHNQAGAVDIPAFGERQREAGKRLGLAHSAEVTHMREFYRTVGSDEVNTLTGPYGEYLVPTEFRSTLWQNAIEQTVFVQDCTFISMTSQKMDMNAIDDYDHSGGTVFGGVKCYRVKETTQMTNTRPKFSMVTLGLTKKIIAIPITDEMLKFSSVAMAPLFGTMSEQAFAWQTDNELLFGTGAGEPLGIVNSPCFISITRNTASTIKPADVNKMWQACPPRLRERSFWLATADLEDDMQEWSATMGTAGQLLYMPPGGLSQQPYATIKGRPVRYSEHCKAPNTVGDFMLVVPSEYLYARHASGVEEAYSIHLRFDYAEGMFRYIVYDEGQPWHKSAFTPQNGTTTFSPFIGVAAG